MDPKLRDNIFKGLPVKIKDEGDEIIEGIVDEVLTLISIDYDGIYVQLKTGEVGNVIEIIETKTGKNNQNIISKLKRDLRSEEGQFLEFKELA